METNWTQVFQPLFQQYGKRKHPLDYQSDTNWSLWLFFSAQDSDKHINELAPKFFAVYPGMSALSNATEADRCTDHRFGAQLGKQSQVAHQTGADRW